MPVLSTVGAASLRAFGAFRPSAAAVSFISATGGTVYTDPSNADYKIHQFTGNGTFTVTAMPSGATVQLMMVAGGAGGDFGGGGAGGYIYRSTFSVSPGSFSVVIGSGGATGQSGGDTTFGGLTAIGGGAPGTSGVSGGGGTATLTAGGSGLQPTSSSGGYGNAGGVYGGVGFDGGGGGAGGTGNLPTAGGVGRTSDIISSSSTYETVAAGGYGNRFGNSVDSPDATANSGNGGWGGGYDDPSGNPISAQVGQAGIVRIRYKFQ